MELATPPPPPSLPIPYRNNISHSKGHNSGLNSMSQDYHQQGIFSFSNGFEIRSQQQQQQQHIAQQIRRDKLRLQGFEQPPPPLVAIEEMESGGVYETAGMLSEMFNFQPGTGPELLENQMSAVDYRNPRPPSSQVSGNDWYGNNRGMVGSGGGGGNINVESSAAAAMQLFLMQPRSPSPAPSQPPPSSSSTLHMLLPDPPPPSNSSNLGFHHTTTTTVGGSATSPPGGGVPSFVGPAHQFTWINPSTVHEGQGLSLSLSSSLQHLEAAKAEELRMGDDSGMLFFNNHGGSGGVGGGAQYQYKNLGVGHHHLQVHAGIGMVNVLRNSKYVKAAQELLEEFCSVGRGQYFKKHKIGSKPNNSNNPSNGSSFSSKDLPPLSASDRIEHQRRKVKLLAMLDEVDRRYNHYCEQMQMVVNSFDLVMGFGAAIPYTALAQKAMSRHFRCLKDAIATQLKNSCEVLGEKDVGTSGVTKGETPRLKLLEQSLRQQRAFNQMGMMEQEAWRPQRGLPERSVNTLRAWLFEHFLHPYPSDADKHLLARQTGLSRNQVSNWFINARVRLWKPMVEEMYQQESKEDAEERERDQQDSDPAQTPMPTTNITTPTLNPPSPPPPSSSLPSPSINALSNDTSLVEINTHYFSKNQAKPSFTTLPPPSKTYADYRTITTDVATTASENAGIGSTPIRFGTAAGDVSLTLGLRHTGNPPEKAPFSVRDFGDC